MIYIIITLAVITTAWLVWEFKNAPLLDENYNVVKKDKDDKKTK
jgi:hypothetical protein